MRDEWTKLPVAESGPATMSPFSKPTHSRCWKDGDRLSMEFRYVDGEEPTNFFVSDSGTQVLLGRQTGRLRGIRLPMSVVHEIVDELLPRAKRMSAEDRRHAIATMLMPILGQALASVAESLRPTDLNQESAAQATAPRVLEAAAG